MKIFLAVFLFILGASIGSFLNVLIDRWVSGETLWGRSHCDKCGHQLAWYDLIPIFSYLYLKGKCRYCGAKISFYLPLVEILTAVLFVVVWFYFSSVNLIVKISYLGIISTFIVIFFSDLKYQIITDESEILLLLFSILLHFGMGEKLYKFGIYVFAAFCVALPIFALFVLTRGKGMGFGDVKFGLNMGFLLGIKEGLIALYLSFIFGAAIGIFLILFGKSRLKSKVPFGPFLVISSVLMLFSRVRMLRLFSLFFPF